MARKMVCEWGMSDKMGPLTFGKSEEHIFLGREMSRAEGLQRGHGDPHRLRDQADRDRLRGRGRARILETNLEKLHALARALLERESLDGEEINRILSRAAASRKRRPRPERSTIAMNRATLRGAGGRRRLATWR